MQSKVRFIEKLQRGRSPRLMGMFRERGETKEVQQDSNYLARHWEQERATGKEQPSLIRCEVAAADWLEGAGKSRAITDSDKHVVVAIAVES